MISLDDIKPGASDPIVRVMFANDAAGEGVNLQRGAHLMVNYDLPWNRTGWSSASAASTA
jgi:hypothetical protein